MDERRRRQYILLARAEKKLKRIKGDEDRISGLPDELIHKIYSHLDAKEAVQSSVLSKRWKLIWTTLPFLGFGRSLGIFSIKVEAPELENVNIKLKDWFSYGGHLNKKKYYQGFTCMLSGLGTAKNISFDLESIKALSEIINIQASVSSPFINLKYLKLPMEYKESSLSSALRSYLLGGSPRATIVSSVAQNRIHQPREVSVAAENVVLQEPLAAPTKVPCDCQYVNKTVTVDMGVQERRIL
ncbi:F-box/FBD/LRR-repeat protein At4g00160-like isoform X2 [Apium graveolens]|uniref:F-box/FBD/LRR-repeat protein At4g00160-like isoform X2 n=1 Tax=Apium graveolens TaxID=4045 RepID=UPI003D79EF5D